MGEVVWFTRRVICQNGIEEKSKYPVWIGERVNVKRAAARAGRSADTSKLVVARDLNNNFLPNRDRHLSLTYDDKGIKKILERAEALRDRFPKESAEDLIFRSAQIEASNWVRRVQRKIGAGDFKYIIVTSDRKKMKSGELMPVRIHHHVIVNGEALEACREKWGNGNVLDKEMKNDRGDFTPLANYLIGQVRHIPDMKKYTPSRNLVPPIIEAPVRVTRFAESEMKVPAGCELRGRSEYIRGEPQYIRYWRPPERRRATRRTEKIRKKENAKKSPDKGGSRRENI